MPDDAKPQTPLDLTLDFESFATKPATPAPTESVKPIDLDWDEATPPVAPVVAPTVVPVVAPRSTPVTPVADLPEAMPVPVVVPRPTRPPVAPRTMQANPSREFAKERPATKRTMLAVVVVLGLMAATAVALLVLLYALYVGFKLAGTQKPGGNTPNTRRAVQ